MCIATTSPTNETCALAPTTFTHYDTAARLVGEYLTTRMRDVVAAWPGRPVLMLSGGIDRNRDEREHRP